MLMTCERVWTTREGDEIDLHDMETSHIENALPYVRRIAKLDIPYPMFQGDMAQYYAEQAFERESLAVDEAGLWVQHFEEELERRKQAALAVPNL